MAKPTPWGRGAGADAAGTVGSAFAGTPGGAAAATGPADDRTERWNRHRATAAALLRRTRDRAEDIRTAPRLSGKWGYVLSALGGVVTFILMFQHWMVARGPDGMAAATAFGRIDTTSRYLAVWSSKGAPPAADLTGSWAVTASAAIAVTLAAVAIYIVTDSPRFARVATGAAVLTAVLVVANLLYLTARQKSLKNMTARRWDLGGQIGSWIDWAFNDGTKPVAGLNQIEYVASGTVTAAAITAVIVAVAGAVIAVAMMPRPAAGSSWLPWRISVSRATTANYVAAGTERPPDPVSTVDTAVTRSEESRSADGGPPADESGASASADPGPPQR
ncbi:MULTISPECIES: hypothetical protein [Nocardia]|uniref:hypothetical protein n=1 Tax=Nocardia TaxID=1817 RepID=UPI00189459F4|nr:MULTISPECIES: hypothetical protein [Nocardia]MBF6347996.1 hypothetical protein [Nocardia flavorosea]